MMDYNALDVEAACVFLLAVLLMTITFIVHIRIVVGKRGQSDRNHISKIKRNTMALGWTAHEYIV